MKFRSFRCRNRLGAVCAFAAASVLSASTHALAGVAPPVLEMDIQVFSATDPITPIFEQLYNPTNAGPFGPVGSNAWTYDAGVFNPQFNITGELNASPTTSPTSAFLNTTLNFANNSLEELWFLISIRMPLAHTLNMPLEWASSASWTLTGPTPQLTTLDGAPLWSVSADNTELGSLFPDSTVMNNQNLNMSDAMDGVAPNAPSEFMTIDLAFTLSPDAVGGVNGTFQIIPAPGALALLGLAGLVGSTRRRRK